MYTNKPMFGPVVPEITSLALWFNKLTKCIYEYKEYQFMLMYIIDVIGGCSIDY